MAEVTALNYLNPVYVTLGAVLVFGEQLAARRILAIARGAGRRAHHPAPGVPRDRARPCRDARHRDAVRRLLPDRGPDVGAGEAGGGGGDAVDHRHHRPRPLRAGELGHADARRAWLAVRRRGFRHRGPLHDDPRLRRRADERDPAGDLPATRLVGADRLADVLRAGRRLGDPRRRADPRRGQLHHLARGGAEAACDTRGVAGRRCDTDGRLFEIWKQCQEERSLFPEMR